jgi:excisionase family DNA binding protein
VPDTDRPILMSVVEAAAMLGIAPRTAYDLIHRDEFPVPVLKVGRRMKVSRTMLERFASEGPIDVTT